MLLIIEAEKMGIIWKSIVQIKNLRNRINVKLVSIKNDSLK